MNDKLMIYPGRYPGLSSSLKENVEIIPATVTISILQYTRPDGVELTISKPNLPGRSHAPSSMSTQIHRKPTHNNRHRAVTSTGHEEKRPVLYFAVRFSVHVQQNPEPGHCYAYRDYRECESVA